MFSSSLSAADRRARPQQLGDWQPIGIVVAGIVERLKDKLADAARTAKATVLK